ncbi:MAG TPA: hypothetical protein VM099_07765 [Gemmatimonadaceae bacterium]|nr:hypothetical protein [Gemmatimonadaceae bacterium]
MRFTGCALVAALAAASTATFAQPSSVSVKDSARDTLTAKKSNPSAAALDFSGTIFANYQYRGEAGPGHAQNKFDVERVYLTFRLPAGERTSVRVTTDVFQQTTSPNDTYYRGWVIRAKFAYLQYNYLDGPNWKANVRVGLLHTVFIDHDEQFWPRWVAPTPTERAGYFASSDGGIATTISLPAKWGELYATTTNGPGYTSREVDRFKDYASRLTLTPFSNAKSKYLRAVAVTGWYYKGALASKFVTAAAGEVGGIGSALDRDRWGVHLGANDPRYTFGVEYAGREDEGETGLNTILSPRAVIDSGGHLIAAYALAHPFAVAAARSLQPLSFFGRFDRVTTNTTNGWKYNVVIAGMMWDLSKRASMSLDYQEQTSVKGRPASPTRTYFAHFVARF